MVVSEERAEKEAGVVAVADTDTVAGTRAGVDFAFPPFIFLYLACGLKILEYGEEEGEEGEGSGGNEPVDAPDTDNRYFSSCVACEGCV